MSETTTSLAQLDEQLDIITANLTPEVLMPDEFDIVADTIREILDWEFSGGSFQDHARDRLGYCQTYWDFLDCKGRFKGSHLPKRPEGIRAIKGSIAAIEVPKEIPENIIGEVLKRLEALLSKIEVLSVDPQGETAYTLDPISASDPSAKVRASRGPKQKIPGNKREEDELFDQPGSDEYEEATDLKFSDSGGYPEYSNPDVKPGELTNTDLEPVQEEEQKEGLAAWPKRIVTAFLNYLNPPR